MEEIIMSIINGQRKQAIKQLYESPYLFVDLIVELELRDMIDEIIRMLRVAESVGYISYNSANAKRIK